MRHLLPFVLAFLPALVAAAPTGSANSPDHGTITFSGRILDGEAPVAPGRVVSVRGNVIAHSAGCIEARIASPQAAGDLELWLCPPGNRIAGTLPGVGEPIAARARITGVKATPQGTVPFSDSFVLLRAD